ncbi:MAG: glycogen/starch synthase, partial [Terrimicrobiaceae bacterium]|nr:glycogen/starch synthase [Terrimicrobiaceae bacterium]
MKILLAASECAPFSEGIMGEAVARLARELRALGHDAQVVVPLTRQAREAGRPRRTRKKFPVAVGAAVHPCEVWQGEAPDGVPAWFLRRDEFFDRSGLYGNESGDYSDNAARFIFFSKGAVELARKLEVDALGAHGWHAALCAAFAREGGLGRPVVLTPHGLDFQGNFWSHDFALTNLPGGYFSAAGLEFYGSLNFLKGGIVFADAVVLPGELFVAAAQTPAFGCGLEKLLAGLAGKLHGIP